MTTSGSPNIGRPFAIVLVASLAVLFVETSLQAAKLLFGLGRPPESPVTRRYERAAYAESPWAQEWFSEFEHLEYTFSPVLGWRAKRFAGAHINVLNEGRRRTWRPHEAENGCLLLFFGGSTMWGTGARDDFTIPSLTLRTLFDEHGRRCRGINLGQSGRTSTQSLMELLLLLRDGIRPTHVVFYDGVNDVYAAYQEGFVPNAMNASLMRHKMEDRRRGLAKALTGVKEFLVDNSMIVQSLQRVRNAFTEPARFSESGHSFDSQKLQELAAALVSQYRANIDAVKRLASSFDFEVLAYWQPSLFTEDVFLADERESDPRILDKKLDSLFDSALTAVRREPSDTIDLSEILKNRKKPCFIDFSHVSEEGNAVIGTRVAADIYKTLK